MFVKKTQIEKNIKESLLILCEGLALNRNIHFPGNTFIRSFQVQMQTLLMHYDPKSISVNLQGILIFQHTKVLCKCINDLTLS